MRITKEVMFYAKQLAAKENRNFSNLVETLILQEIEKARAEGFKFKKYVPEGGEIEGTAGEKDEDLDDEFKRFSKE
jgi:hypothetical protein